ncbi:STAS domain-containing protein [Saccharopolyspora sp. HNM0983]|uniref:STAS domain-containing protein n=1 Tax=Saccharopolyspora montiporae TaxID=2781240 RepID=A0A929B7K8_9PSEU|nr:STAS domain-containing protein [Saccharopolyspora sp. HNM0983]MBE9373665.1 STAS domain-containing protein [Saccharopolyspora sp. HNM0983]
MTATPQSPPEEPVDPAQNARLGVQRPSRYTTVVTASGELDEPAVPRFTELLAARLSSTVDAIVVDWSHLDFVCLDAVDVLRAAQRRARARGIILRVVTGPACVHSALKAGGLRETTGICADRIEALADLP